ncbi:MAG: L-threonylcarbamoyladenylate synthase [Desulfobacterales bacterium]|nr:L-threonylcarbamoyladenylate synthase [Desulfobacterales bacterium]
MIKKQKSLKIIQVDPLNPSHDQILEAYRIVKNGGVIMFPTQHLYGLGAEALNIKAVDKVFKIKQRPYNKPLLVLIHEQKDLTKLVQQIPSSAIRIMECFWPGALTIVFEAKKVLPANLTAGTDRIGVRMPQHPVALALAKALKSPITATSANITGHSGCSQVSDIDPLIADPLDLILDAGPLKGGIGSTVVDVTHDFPKILREGAIPAKDIFAVLGGADIG